MAWFIFGARSSGTTRLTIRVLKLEYQGCHSAIIDNGRNKRSFISSIIWRKFGSFILHYNDVMMGTMDSQIVGVSIVCSAVCSRTDQRKYQNSASLAFVRGIHRWPMNSPHKWPVTQKMFPFDDVIMRNGRALQALTYHVSHEPNIKYACHSDVPCL